MRTFDWRLEINNAVNKARKQGITRTEIELQVGKAADVADRELELEAADPQPACTCTYGSYLRHGGGTDWGIVKYDDACPEHGDQA